MVLKAKHDQYSAACAAMTGIGLYMKGVPGVRLERDQHLRHLQCLQKKLSDKERAAERGNSSRRDSHGSHSSTAGSSRREFAFALTHVYMAAASHDTGLLLCTLPPRGFRRNGELGHTANVYGIWQTWGAGRDSELRTPIPQDRIGECSSVLPPPPVGATLGCSVLKGGANHQHCRICVLPLLANGLELYAKGLFAVEKGYVVALPNALGGACMYGSVLNGSAHCDGCRVHFTMIISPGNGQE